MHSVFDTVVVVDWSASATPSPARPSPNAIWIGIAREGSDETLYCRTRAEAEARVTALLDAEHLAGRRTLAGFDFPFGYPEGFARRLTGKDGAAQVWHWLARQITDGPNNHNDRFHLADGINARLSGRGPFWGRPRSLPLPHLPETRAVDYAALALAERRRVETIVPRAQSVWKLYTTGSVGGQALTGLPLIARLSQRPHTGVWPFDPPGAALVLAEVYPSLINAAVVAEGGPASIKDEQQVRLLARALWRLSETGQLARLLDDPPDWPGRADEGWILGAGHTETLMQALP